MSTRKRRSIRRAGGGVRSGLFVWASPLGSDRSKRTGHVPRNSKVSGSLGEMRTRRAEADAVLAGDADASPVPSRLACGGRGKREAASTTHSRNSPAKLHMAFAREDPRSLAQIGDCSLNGHRSCAVRRLVRGFGRHSPARPLCMACPYAGSPCRSSDLLLESSCNAAVARGARAGASNICTGCSEVVVFFQSPTARITTLAQISKTWIAQFGFAAAAAGVGLQNAASTRGLTVGSDCHREGDRIDRRRGFTPSLVVDATTWVGHANMRTRQGRAARRLKRFSAEAAGRKAHSVGEGAVGPLPA